MTALYLPAQPALLRLVKAKGRPEDQAREAANILGVDLETLQKQLNESTSAESVGRRDFAPKEEWVLRWLLKKMRVGEEDSLEYRSNYYVWILIWHLLGCLPPKTIAKLFLEHRFLSTLPEILNDLSHRADIRDAKAIPDRNLQSDSSSTLQGSPIPKPRKQGKKRKRDDVVGDGHPNINTPQGSVLRIEVRPVFLSIRKVIHLADNSSDPHDVSRDQLKTALRGDSETVAVTSGRAYQILDQILNESEDVAAEAMSNVLEYLEAIISLWDMRSNSEDKAANVSSNAAFSSKCALPALKLVQTMSRDGLSPKSSRHDCVKRLEGLIARHVIMPARASYLSPPGTRKPFLDLDSSDPAVESLVEELRALQGAGGKDAATPLLSPRDEAPKLLPRLLDIALRATPRKGLQQQSIESPWSETLFRALADLAGFSTQKGVSKPLAPSVELLEELLNVAINGKVPLSLKLLYCYTSRYSRVFDNITNKFAKTFDNRSSSCEWSLLSKMAHLGVDIFIPNSGIKDADRLLDATLQKATVLCLGPSGQADDYYNFVEANILIPIMRGFARARDLGAFTDRWYDQLNAFSDIFTEKDLWKTSIPISIWESDNMIKSFSDLVPSSFTADQLRNQCDLAIKALRSIDEDSAALKRGLNRILIMEALLRPSLADEYTPFSVEQISSLAGVIASMLSGSSAGLSRLHRWRLWRILGLTSECHHQLSTTSRAKESRVVDLDIAVPQIMRDVLNSSHSFKWQELAEALEAFKYLTTSPRKVQNAQDRTSVATAIEVVIETLTKETYSKDELTSLRWNGRVQTLDSRLKLSLAYAASLTANSDPLKIVSSQTRQDFFQAVYGLARVSCAELSDHDVGDPKPPFLSIWVGLATQASISHSKAFWEDFLQVQVSSFEQNGLEISTLAVLNAVLPESISRARRTKILDALLEGLSNVIPQLPRSVVLNAVTLMIKFLDLPNPTARILTETGTLCNLVEQIDIAQLDVDTFAVVEKLTVSVLTSLKAGQGNKRAQEYLAPFCQRIVQLMKDQTSLHDVPAQLALLKASIPFLWSNRGSMLDDSLNKLVGNVRHKLTRMVISDLDTIVNEIGKLDRANYSSLVCEKIETLSQFQDLLNEDERLPRILNQLTIDIKAKRILLTNASTTDIGSEFEANAKADALVGELNFKNGTASLSKAVEDLLTVLSSPRLDISSQQKALQAAKRIFAKGGDEGMLNFLRCFSVSNVPGDRLQSSQYMLGLVLSSSETQPDKDSMVSSEVSRLFGELIQHLLFASSIGDFCLTVDGLDLISRAHHRSMSQLNIDGTLSVIAAATSVSGPAIGSSNVNEQTQYAGIIFSRLCRLMGSILVLHRKKVGGRYHLVVAALQGLLRCLFVPERSRVHSSSALLPPWIGSRKEGLGREHALQYTRLLTMICDPTVSSVKRTGSSKAQQLTDETRKARGVAGQYLQYLIREYAQCQLHGRISPEVQAALMPGMYAILQAMTREGMRAMNMAMDSSSRSIFKSLYDDYQRFGKWDQT